MVSYRSVDAWLLTKTDIPNYNIYFLGIVVFIFFTHKDCFMETPLLFCSLFFVN